MADIGRRALASILALIWEAIYIASRNEILAVVLQKYGSATTLLLSASTLDLVVKQ